MTAHRPFPAEGVRAAWEEFPRQHARTQGFTLGTPRRFTVAPDGSRVAFIRSSAGDDPVGRLWVLDLPAGVERCVADPAELGAANDGLPPEERARRERVRESGGGITAYATDEAVSKAVFTLGGRLFLADLDADPEAGATRAVTVDGAVVDPRLDPAGERIAFVRAGALWVVDVDPDADEPRRLVGEDDPDVTWGLPEFVAAEEMDRQRGFWWAPDGRTLAVARVDVSTVTTWYVTDPADPAGVPTALRYPAAGAPNADVTLALVDLDGRRLGIGWDRATYPYLADVWWSTRRPLLAAQTRDQRRLAFVTVEPTTGACEPLRELADDRWVDLVPGLPRVLDDGRLLHALDDPEADARRLAVNGVAVSPQDLQIRGVAGIADGAAVVTASAGDPTAVAVWRIPLDGADAEPLTPAAGVHQAAAGGDVVVVITGRTLDRPDALTEVHHAGGTLTIATNARAPALAPRVQQAALGARGLRSALLLPNGWTVDDGPLPVLCDPYGGPHAQRVMQARAAFGVSQWFADAGYAVLVTDGRGSPGRGPAWERTIAGDLATAPLADQVDALHAAAEAFPGTLDLDRVAIRGWSFGGYLAALAVLRRPDVFHAAVAGAPVTEWRLYDTHYTERYLGLPEADADAYDRSGLLPDAPGLTRPLLLIHGLADDNVVAAHTLRLSRALLEAGRPHRVLPLVGVTHMTPQEAVAEALLHLQLDFLDDALDVAPQSAQTSLVSP
ncbi:MAG: prolyl oligopeptidase family serine peptidase [Egibacteraceae bacterium]